MGIDVAVDVEVARFSSSTTDGRRAARGKAEPCLEDEVDDERGSRAAANVVVVVLLLRGIPEVGAASESSLRLVESVFSPSCRPGSRLTDPNSGVLSVL